MATEATIIKLTMCIVIVLTTCVNTNAKKKHHKESSNFFKENNDKAVTFFVMGNESRDTKNHKSRHQHALSKTDHVTNGNDTSRDKADSHQRKTVTSSRSSQTKKLKVAHKHSHKFYDRKSHETKKTNSISRQNIASEINKIDDVEGAYKQGINDDDDMDKVKMIDDGELTDYFHAINGDDKPIESTTKSYHHDNDESQANQHGDSQYENSNSDPKSNKQDGSPEYKFNRQQEGGPGYEIFTDNPEEADSDDFYNEIDQGKNPADNMKKLRPTKSHFGHGQKLSDAGPTMSISKARGEEKISKFDNSEQINNEESFQQQQGQFDDQQGRAGLNPEQSEQKENQGVDQSDGHDVTSDKSQGSIEPDQNIMDYPYPIDNAHAPTEGNSAVAFNNGNTESTVNTDNTANKANTANAVVTATTTDVSKTANKTNTSNSRKVTIKPAKTSNNDKQEQNMQQNISPELNESNSEAVTGNQDYADSKEGQAQSNAYNQFLANPFFNPFDMFGFNKKPKDGKYDQKDGKENTSNKELSSNSLQIKETKAEGGKLTEKGNNELSAPLEVKGTKIQGGKITGGTITGGLIKGGEITAGNIEGGTITGGYVEGGKFKNGTMEGGIFHDGLIEGGSLVNGSFEGGLMKGGSVHGGKVKGGFIEGGDIKGGVLLGGSFRGGSLEGGVMRGGEIKGGSIKGGNMEGGTMTGGSVEGGVLKYGKLSGGTIKAGTMLGGEMTNGSIEGGILKGGSISGGVLRGGVMEKGQLKGGVVLAGKINGGIIEGGVIEGGEIGEGVIIKGGRINATILAAKGNEKSGKGKGKNEKNENELNGNETNENELNQNESNEKTKEKRPNTKEEKEKEDKKVEQQNKSAAKAPPLIMPEPKRVEMTDTSTGIEQNIPLNPNMDTMNDQGIDSTQPMQIPKAQQPQLMSPSTVQAQGESPLQPSQGFRQTPGVGRDSTASGRGKHHIVFDGVSFDIPDEGFSNLIRRINGNSKEIGELINFGDENKPHEVKHGVFIDDTKTNDKEKNKQDKKTEKTAAHQDEAGIKPEDIMSRLSPTRRRSLSDMDANITAQTMNSKIPKLQALKPSYHWSLSNIIGDRIPGSPGAAMISHGHIVKTRGGLAFNGEDAWLGAGDFAGGCVSAPDKCDDGFSFEMTLKMDKESFKSNDMRYIVDSGASTFNSKGFSLYTLHGKLRADIAIPNDSLCLETPLETDRWHDVLVTWRKDKGLKLYLNCELKGKTSSSEHCLGCRSPGCHVTDVNTQLMIGRPNYSPHFHCTKFESGDVSFWEKYLDDDDVNVLCGRGAVASPENFLTSTKPTSGATQLEKSQPMTSQQDTGSPTGSMEQPYTNYQQNDPMTGQQPYQQPNTAQMSSYPAPYPAPYPEPLTFLKPGTYHFTEYIPAMNPGTAYSSNQMSQGYYPSPVPAPAPAPAPAPDAMNTLGLYSSRPSYVPGGKRELSRVVSVDFAKMLEDALQASDGNLIVARQNIQNARKHGKMSSFMTHLHRRHRKKSKIPKNKSRN